MLLAGVDEAGRGCLLGPLVMCLAIIDTDSMYNEEYYKNLGIKDSKLLTAKRRSQLFKQIKSHTKFEVACCKPQEIDDAVNSTSTNLNWLEADHTIKLINKTAPNIVIVDCPSPNLSAYNNYIKKGLTTSSEIRCEHKADLNNVVVGLASVIAKYLRDSYIKVLRNRYGSFGSGYPGDSLTRQFVINNPDSPIIRKSWSSYKALTLGATQIQQNP